MRGRSDVVAALVNFFIVQLLPSGIVGVLAIGSSLGIGAKANEVTVHPPGWTPVIAIAETALQFGLVTLPFALLAAWRTWVHAKRWLECGTSGWEGVGEAAACGLATLLVMLLPGILEHPIQALPYIVAYGGLASILGLLVGLLLRATAVTVLKLAKASEGSG
jgi:hypothetical protein